MQIPQYLSPTWKKWSYLQGKVLPRFLQKISKLPYFGCNIWLLKCMKMDTWIITTFSQWVFLMCANFLGCNIRIILTVQWKLNGKQLCVTLFFSLIWINSHSQGLRYLPGLNQNLPLPLYQSINKTKTFRNLFLNVFFQKYTYVFFHILKKTTLYVLKITSKLVFTSSECSSLP